MPTLSVFRSSAYSPVLPGAHGRQHKGGESNRGPAIHDNIKRITLTNGTRGVNRGSAIHDNIKQEGAGPPVSVCFSTCI